MTLHTSHSTLYTALHSLPFTLYTPHALHSALHTSHLTLDTPHFTLYTLHYTLAFTLYTLHSTLYALHSTLYTVHSTLLTWHSALTLHTFTLHTVYLTLHTPHSTLCTLHSTLYTLHLQPRVAASMRYSSLCVSTSVPLAYVWPFRFVGCILFAAAEFTSHESCDSVQVCLEAPVARWNLKPEMIETYSKTNSLVLVHSHDCHQNFEEQTRHLEIYWNQKVKCSHMNLPHKKSNSRGRDWGMQVLAQSLVPMNNREKTMNVRPGRMLAYLWDPMSRQANVRLEYHDKLPNTGLWLCVTIFISVFVAVRKAPGKPAAEVSQT